jgi:hypothetical protein
MEKRATAREERMARENNKVQQDMLAQFTAALNKQPSPPKNADGSLKTGRQRVGSTTLEDGKAARPTAFCTTNVPVISWSSSVMEVDAWSSAVQCAALAARLSADTHQGTIATIAGIVPLDVILMLKVKIDLDDAQLYKKYPHGDYIKLLANIVKVFVDQTCDANVMVDVCCRKQHSSESITQYAQVLEKMIGHTIIYRSH